MMQCTQGELSVLSQMIHDMLPHGGVIILQGDLASGKTTFTQAFAAFMGLRDAVTSPTFSLQQVYGEKLFHYDLYNYGFDKFLSMGMMEELERAGYHLIEWGDDALIGWLKRSGIETIIITIMKNGEESRNYEVQRA